MQEITIERQRLDRSGEWLWRGGATKMGNQELQDKITDLEMQLRMSRACSEELRADLQAWKQFAEKTCSPCKPVISRSTTTGAVDIILIAP